MESDSSADKSSDESDEEMSDEEMSDKDDEENTDISDEEMDGSEEEEIEKEADKTVTNKGLAASIKKTRPLLNETNLFSEEIETDEEDLDSVETTVKDVDEKWVF